VRWTLRDAEQGGTRRRPGWNDLGRGDHGAATLIVGAPTRCLARSAAGCWTPSPWWCAWMPGARVPRAGPPRRQVAVDAPGQQVVLDQLLDWMLVCPLRE
jgi:hypothetical protein